MVMLLSIEKKNGIILFFRFSLLYISLNTYNVLLQEVAGIPEAL